jgi:hypothetical protein
MFLHVVLYLVLVPLTKYLCTLHSVSVCNKNKAVFSSPESQNGRTCVVIKGSEPDWELV